MTSIQDFDKLDIRVGKIVSAELIPEAKHSTHKLTIDFGTDIGKKTSCARIVNYKCEQLIDKIVLGVVNLPARKIGKNLSEVLTLGVPDSNGNCVLIQPERSVPIGGKLF